jgi:hypothetical protein
MPRKSKDTEIDEAEFRRRGRMGQEYSRDSAFKHSKITTIAVKAM